MQTPQKQTVKIGIAFSAGGHYLEAMKACRIILNDPSNEIFFLTYRLSNIIAFTNKCYYVTHPKHGFVIKRMFLLLINFIDSFRVYIKEKPDIVISTGADVALSLMLIAKLFKKKVIFIESGANVTKPSMTGRIIYRFADVFIIQWDELKVYYPNAITGVSLL